MRNCRYTAVLLVVGFLLGASAAPASVARRAARGNETTPAVRSAMDLLHQLASLLVSLYSKEGCHIDPLGGCIPGSATAPTGDSTSNGDVGCQIDPWGGCAGGR